MNPMDFMKNIKDLQARAGEAQEKMKKLRAQGFAGGDLIKIEIDGTMEVLSVSIDPVAVDPRDVKMLEELIGAAFTDAVRKMRGVLQKEMSQFAGGMNLPFDLSGFTGG